MFKCIVSSELNHYFLSYHVHRHTHTHTHRQTDGHEYSIVAVDNKNYMAQKSNQKRHYVTHVTSLGQEMYTWTN